MNSFVRLCLPLSMLALLAGCTGMGRTATVVQTAPQVTATAPPPALSGPVLPTPAQTTQTAMQTTSVSSGFVDPAALSRMSARDTSEASSAQFYALQFGRPGAPRQWSGDGGTTGTVSVGPYVRVNNLDCREFTHTVRSGGQDYVRRGTACREQTGNWTVVQGA